jgi:hypothetical protein
VIGQVTREALLEAARTVLQTGLSGEQAVVVGFSRLVGEPLDPFAFDEAAVILRAERLLMEGLGVVDAVHIAREELVTWAVPS